jgi:hypothetical protein
MGRIAKSETVFGVGVDCDLFDGGGLHGMVVVVLRTAGCGLRAGVIRYTTGRRLAP